MRGGCRVQISGAIATAKRVNANHGCGARKMIVITEEQARELVTLDEAITAIDGVFRAMDSGAARNFPVVRERLEGAGGTFGVKSAVDLASGVVGLKAGGYWPGNASRGMKNHQSTTLLCDAASGQALALVAANYLTAIRTAAASAVATRALSRPGAVTLAVIGAGAQSLPQIEAQCAVRPFRRLLVAARDPTKAAALAEAARRFVTDSTAVPVDEAVCAADVVVTLTPATAPVVMSEWVQPGTHINAVGSDTRGKQELDLPLVLRARIVVDEWQQSMRIGECQQAAAEGTITEVEVATIGAVLNGTAAGRSDSSQVTVFDSTGVSLQDLAVAHLAMERVKGSAG